MIRKKVELFISMSGWTDKNPLELYDIVTANIEKSIFTLPNFISAVEFSDGFLRRFNRFGKDIKRIKETEL